MQSISNNRHISDTILSTTVTFNYHFNCLLPQTGGLPYIKRMNKQTWIPGK